MTHTPGPWTWYINAGHDDEGPIDWSTWHSTGYSGNPRLQAGEPDDMGYRQDIVSAGAGEYTPIHGKTDAERAANARLIAKAPAMLALLKRAIGEGFCCECLYDHDAYADDGGWRTAARKLIASIEDDR